MDKKKNCYEILGLKSEIINWILHQKDNGVFELATREEEQKDKIIKQSYDFKMKVLEQGIKMNTGTEKIKEIQKNMQELTTAYETIKSQPLRNIYNEELERIERKKERPLIDETAYDFFNISEKSLNMYSVNRVNSLIKSSYNRIMERYNQALQDKSIGFRQRKKVEYRIAKAKQYYNLIDTPEKRKEYEKDLNEKEQEANEKYRKELIKIKYSKKNYYNKDLINTNREGKEKVVRIEAKRTPYISLENEGSIFERNIFIRKTAEIIFENCTGVLESDIGEYEVIKTINGEEKRDIIYTDLLLSDLEIDEKTGKPVNPQYYDCVVNKLLSEDMIEGSKYNDGYIGLIEKKENGEYNTTLGKEGLNPMEQESMTAVMIMKEQQKRDNAKKLKKEGR